LGAADEIFEGLFIRKQAFLLDSIAIAITGLV
jgi:hypothetical protein